MDLGAVDLDHILLAGFGVDAFLAIVLEEAVHASANDVEILGAEDTQAPGLLAAFSLTRGEVRVVPFLLGLEWDQGVGVGLVVWGLGLDEAHVDVLSVGDLVVVQLVVFGGGAVHPDWALALDEGAAAVVDVDLVVVGQVEFVVGGPHPGVVDVGVSLFGGVEEHEGADAFWVRLGGLLWCLCALVALELRAG